MTDAERIKQIESRNGWVFFAVVFLLDLAIRFVLPFPGKTFGMLAEAYPFGFWFLWAIPFNAIIASIVVAPMLKSYAERKGVAMQFSVAIAIGQIITTYFENLIGFGIAGFLAQYAEVAVPAIVILALVNSGTLSMYVAVAANYRVMDQGGGRL